MADIGYHYVATTANGTPIDTDADKTPDYLEDANGNGQTDPGESRWDLAILSQPQDIKCIIGHQAVFSVTAAGTPNITYQWRKDGHNIPNAVSSTYTIASVRVQDQGYYSVQVSNPGGPLLSEGAYLLPWVWPPWPPITNQPPITISLNY